ncbi:DoxX family protein [Nocardioides sp. CPCC 205120]|uniref:DoxX family protein n=1 Tax=Nocardioides sp. CPCC 205120 TaxID=3406462 RepID=UPI003B50873D
MTLTRLIARPLLASVFVVGGVNAFRNADDLAAKASKVTDKIVPKVQQAGAPVPSDAATLVKATAAVSVLGGFTLATGRAPRLSATVLAATLVPATVADHPFWAESDRAARADHQAHFLKNLSIIGGLVLAAVDTEGKPGLAWRARRAAKDAQRQSRTLAKNAKREAKLARSKVS